MKSISISLQPIAEFVQPVAMSAMCQIFVYMYVVMYIISIHRGNAYSVSFDISVYSPKNVLCAYFSRSTTISGFIHFNKYDCLDKLPTWYWTQEERFGLIRQFYVNYTNVWVVF